MVAGYFDGKLEITLVHPGGDSPQTKVSNECEVVGTQFSLSPTPRPVNQIPKDTSPEKRGGSQ